MNSVLYRLGVVLIVLGMAPSGLGGGGDSGTQVFFSPAPLTQESIRGEIIKRINLSRKSIDIAIYDFTAGPIAQALLDAKGRGVEIRIIMDDRQIKKDTKGHSEYGFLKNNGFNLKVLSGIKGYGIMHNKIAIYDGRVVQTGSYNWSDNAEYNSWENAVFIDDASVAQKYRDYFQRMWNYGGR
ncbi:MAG TPA: phospholipase D-like domain-containing protein [Candidatus Tripitaka californicus]|uniref:phospholipase D-like domain-containing protein n=1 Tax=Candidatus Tripitaka californicus TaxID=3367616 RepID=UPI004028E6E6